MQLTATKLSTVCICCFFCFHIRIWYKEEVCLLIQLNMLSLNPQVQSRPTDSRILLETCEAPGKFPYVKADSSKWRDPLTALSQGMISANGAFLTGDSGLWIVTMEFFPSVKSNVFSVWYLCEVWEKWADKLWLNLLKIHVCFLLNCKHLSPQSSVTPLGSVGGERCWMSSVRVRFHLGPNT